MLDHAQVASRRAGVSICRRPDAGIETRIRLGVNWGIVEKRIELDVIVWDVETWMVKDVEGLKVVSQVEAVVDFEILKNREIIPGLKRPSKNVAATDAVSRFIEIANLARP